MYYTKKSSIPRTAALITFYLVLSAGMVPAAHPLEPGTWGEISSMPEMQDSQSVTPEILTPYQTGVQAYLHGNDEEAISQLQEALRLNAADEKAKRLLLKVMLRTINGNYERNDYKKAHFFIQEAHKYFPANPEVKLLYSSMLESKTATPRKLSAARPETPPAIQAVSPAREKAGRGKDIVKATDVISTLPQPLPAVGGQAVVSSRRTVEAPQKAPHTPGDSTQSPTTAPSSESRVLNKNAQTHYTGEGRDTAAYFTVIALSLLFSAALLIFVYLRQKQEKVLLLRIESLQKALVDGEVRKGEIYRELETRKNVEKQDEELAALRKAKEQRMYLELEKLKSVEETKILAELNEKRREAERAASLAKEVRKVPLPSPDSPETGEAPALPAVALPASGLEHTPARPQENNILEILSGITSPEREAAWERIAVRAADLYETSPEAAIKFLYDLSKDANPLNRASIAGALAAIGAPATLDILFELYNDASMEVRREAIKHLTRLERDLTIAIDEKYREKISACLLEEKTKGDWVF
ncbi:MAG TPA: hypothetical protein DCL44_03905 [Elusimicrobia bacterium]|nr:hypothetical protein [Elusimicrobiota bacterium]